MNRPKAIFSAMALSAVAAVTWAHGKEGANHSAAQSGHSASAKEFVSAFEDAGSKEKKDDDSRQQFRILGYAKPGTGGTVDFKLDPSSKAHIAIPMEMIENVEWEGAARDFVGVRLTFKSPPSAEARIALELLSHQASTMERRARAHISGSAHAKSSIPCHMCGCTNWYDNNDNGLCNGTNWDNPEEYCGHPIISHY